MGTWVTGVILSVITVSFGVTWSHGSEYPVTPKDTVITERITPVTHVSSRGFLNPPVKYTRNTCKIIINTIILADQRCTERMSQPKFTSVIMNCTEANASATVGR